MFLIILAIMFSTGMIGSKSFATMVIIIGGLHIIHNSLDRLCKRLDNNNIPNTPFWTAMKKSYDEHRVDK